MSKDKIAIIPINRGIYTKELVSFIAKASVGKSVIVAEPVKSEQDSVGGPNFKEYIDNLIVQDIIALAKQDAEHGDNAGPILGSDDESSWTPGDNTMKPDLGDIVVIQPWVISAEGITAVINGGWEDEED